MIYQTVNEFSFIEAFKEMDREENFSVNARRELFQYYDDLSDDIGEPMELDVIGICCDWSEYTASELETEYQHLIDVGDYDDDDERFDALLEELPDHTALIEVQHYGDIPNTYLIQGF